MPPIFFRVPGGRLPIGHRIAVSPRRELAGDGNLIGCGGVGKARPRRQKHSTRNPLVATNLSVSDPALLLLLECGGTSKAKVLGGTASHQLPGATQGVTSSRVPTARPMFAGSVITPTHGLINKGVAVF